MAMMYPMKGLSCTGMICPLTTPLVKGVSGLQGTRVLGPPLGMRMGLLTSCPFAAEPFATGVMSNKVKEGEHRLVGNETVRQTHSEYQHSV